MPNRYPKIDRPAVEQPRPRADPAVFIPQGPGLRRPLAVLSSVLKNLLMDDLQLMPAELVALVQQYAVGDFSQLFSSEPFSATTLVLKDTPVDNFHAGVQLPGNDGYLWAVSRNTLSSRGKPEILVVDLRDPKFVLHNTSGGGSGFLRVQSLDLFPKDPVTNPSLLTQETLRLPLLCSHGSLIPASATSASASAGSLKLLACGGFERVSIFSLPSHGGGSGSGSVIDAGMCRRATKNKQEIFTKLAEINIAAGSGQNTNKFFCGSYIELMKIAVARTLQPQQNAGGAAAGGGGAATASAATADASDASAAAAVVASVFLVVASSSSLVSHELTTGVQRVRECTEGRINALQVMHPFPLRHIKEAKARQRIGGGGGGAGAGGGAASGNASSSSSGGGGGGDEGTERKDGISAGSEGAGGEGGGSDATSDFDFDAQVAATSSEGPILEGYVAVACGKHVEFHHPATIHSQTQPLFTFHNPLVFGQDELVSVVTFPSYRIAISSATKTAIFALNNMEVAVQVIDAGGRCTQALAMAPFVAPSKPDAAASSSSSSSCSSSSNSSSSRAEENADGGHGAFGGLCEADDHKNNSENLSSFWQLARAASKRFGAAGSRSRAGDDDDGVRPSLLLVFDGAASEMLIVNSETAAVQQRLPVDKQTLGDYHNTFLPVRVFCGAYGPVMFVPPLGAMGFYILRPQALASLIQYSPADYYFSEDAAWHAANNSSNNNSSSAASASSSAAAAQVQQQQQSDSACCTIL